MSWIKKIFIISSGFLMVTLFFLGVYNLAFKNKDNDKLADTAEKYLEKTKKNEETNSKAKETGKANKNQLIYPISTELVLGPILTKEGNIKYYTQNGNTIEISSYGENQKIISSANLSDLKNVIWSPSGDKVISNFNKNGKDSFFLYDFTKKESKAIPEGTDSIAWSNLGDKIIYKFFDFKTRKRSLSVANPDGSDWKKLADINSRNISLVQVPKSSMVAYWNSPNSLEETSLNTVSILGGESKSIFSGKFGADYLWSPLGEKSLVSSVDSKGGSKLSLGLINKNGGEYTDLGIPTMVSKCAWSQDGKAVYYALPIFSKESIMIPDDYLSKKVTSQDTFWKLDLITGEKQRVVELDKINGNFDAKNLFLSLDEKGLFFVNRLDGKLYRIDL